MLPGEAIFVFFFWFWLSLFVCGLQRQRCEFTILLSSWLVILICIHKDPFLVGFVYISVCFFSFLTTPHSHFAYSHYHQQFHSGSCLLLYVCLPGVYHCSICVHFNFCKWHCFLYPILLLRFYHCAGCCSYPPIVPRVYYS